MAELSDLEIESQIKYLIKIKQEREDVKIKTNELLENNSNKSPYQLYYEAETFEILLELHKKYKLYYDYSIILYRLIEDKDLVFATKLVVSGLISDIIRCTFRCCGYMPAYPQNFKHFQKLVQLLFVVGDLDRLKLLEQFYVSQMAKKHSIKPPVEYMLWSNINTLSNYENNKIELLVGETKKYNNSAHDQLFSYENISDNFWSICKSVIDECKDDNIIKFYISRIKDIITDDKFKIHVSRWVQEKNKSMLEYISMCLYSDHNNRTTTGKKLISEYLRNNLDALYSSNVEWYNYILELCREHNSGCGTTIDGDLYYMLRYIETVTFDIFVANFNTSQTRLRSVTDYYQKHNAVENNRNQITELLYESKKHNRLDIYKFLIDNIPYQ
jgi:hypothetical protein